MFVNNMADSDISDYEFDADDLLLMPIIIPQFDNWCREIFKYNTYISSFICMFSN
jgi:hypothetical protein